MLIVNRESWHFKLVSGFFDRIDWSSSNLCKYFWQVVWSIIMILLVIGVVASVIVVFIINWTITLTVIGCSTFIWLPIVAIVYFRKLGINTEIKNPKQLNLLSEYLKAKKEKICPVIKFN